MARTTVYGVPHSVSVAAPPQPRNSLVFIHGWLLSRHYWQPIIAGLKLDYRCISYDLRGFGDSCYDLAHYEAGAPQQMAELGETLCSRYSLAAYARDLDQMLTQLDLPSVWLVGHSLGGSIALWAAYCYPHRVAGVICINAGGGIYIKQDFNRFRTAGQQIIRFRPPWLAHLPLADRLFARMMVSRPLASAWGRQRLQDLLQADAIAARQSLLESTTEAAVHQLPRIVSTLRQPAYFLSGENDQVMETRFVQHLASFHHRFSGQETVIRLKQCGHIAMVEQPKAVEDAIRYWLALHDA